MDSGKLDSPIKSTYISGGDGGGVTPIPIPNMKVKPSSVDGTALATGWESRTPPESKLYKKAPFEGFFGFGVRLSFDIQVYRKF